MLTTGGSEPEFEAAADGRGVVVAAGRGHVDEDQRADTDEDPEPPLLVDRLALLRRRGRRRVLRRLRLHLSRRRRLSLGGRLLRLRGRRLLGRGARRDAPGEGRVVGAYRRRGRGRRLHPLRLRKGVAIFFVLTGQHVGRTLRSLER